MKEQHVVIGRQVNPLSHIVPQKLFRLHVRLLGGNDPVPTGKRVCRKSCQTWSTFVEIHLRRSTGQNCITFSIWRTSIQWFDAWGFSGSATRNWVSFQGTQGMSQNWYLKINLITITKFSFSIFVGSEPKSSGRSDRSTGAGWTGHVGSGGSIQFCPTFRRSKEDNPNNSRLQERPEQSEPILFN